MKLLKPKLYIESLLKEILQTTECAVKNLCLEKYTNQESYLSREIFTKEMEKVDSLKKELLLVVASMDPNQKEREK